MKVVINRCYGQFRLSDVALKMLRELKSDKRLSSEDFTWDGTGHFYRYDDDLVSVVEKLGSKHASGAYAELDLVEVDTNFCVEDEAGMETVLQPDTVIWLD